MNDKQVEVSTASWESCLAFDQYSLPLTMMMNNSLKSYLECIKQSMSSILMSIISNSNITPQFLVIFLSPLHRTWINVVIPYYIRNVFIQSWIIQQSSLPHAFLLAVYSCGRYWVQMASKTEPHSMRHALKEANELKNTSKRSLACEWL